MIVDPLAAMAAACIAVGNGDANEIELCWCRPLDNDLEETLTITVRREVRHFNLPPVGGE